MYVCTAALLLSLILFPKPSIFSKTLSHQRHGASLVLRCSKSKVEEEICLKSIGGLLMSFAASQIPSQNINIVSGSFSFLIYAILKSLLPSKRTPIIASWNLVRPLLSKPNEKRRMCCTANNAKTARCLLLLEFSRECLKVCANNPSLLSTPFSKALCLLKYTYVRTIGSRSCSVLQTFIHDWNVLYLKTTEGLLHVVCCQIFFSRAINICATIPPFLYIIFENLLCPI
jgi:hypothetical protein